MDPKKCHMYNEIYCKLFAITQGEKKTRTEAHEQKVHYYHENTNTR